MNTFLEKWNQELDDLEVDLDLGEEKISDAYEDLKSSFSSFVDESKAHAEEFLEGEKASKLKQRMEELQVQLALGKAESRDAFEAQKKKLDHAIHNLRYEYDHLAKDAKTDVSEKMKSGVESFQTRLEILRLQFALGAAEAKDEWEERKKEIKEKVHHARQKLKKEVDDDKWDDFKEEMGEAFSHIKGALQKLFS